MAATLHIVLFLLATLVVVATGLSLIRGGYWWARAFDFPRLQTAALGLLVLIALLADRPLSAADVAFAGALGLALGYQAWCILPYTRLRPPEVLRATHPGPERRLSLLIANVMMDNRNADGLLRIVRGTDPDMLLAMETDGFWAEKLSVLDDAYPFSLKHPLGNTYGMLLLSRLALKDSEVRFLLEAEEVPSFRARVALRSGDAFTFYGVHPRPPYLLQDASRRDAELLLVGREAQAEGGPAIVAGDLNDVAWSHTTRLFQRTSGLLDPRVGRGLYSTFHARYPFLRWPLDHVFVSHEFRLCRLERLPAFGSDHFPILIAVSYEPARADEQEEPAPEPGDRHETRERIAEGREQAATEEPQI